MECGVLVHHVPADKDGCECGLIRVERDGDGVSIGVIVELIAMYARIGVGVDGPDE